MDYTEFEKLVFKVFDTDDGKLLMKELYTKFVNVGIVQDDGMIPSSIRQGKSDLVRMLAGIYMRIEKDI